MLSSFSNPRGFILVSVLAMMALLSFLVVVTRVNVAAVTQEVAFLHTRADRPALVKAALDIAAAKILARLEETVDGKSVPKPLLGQASHKTEKAELAIEFRNLASLVDLNLAKPELITAALRSAGANQVNAEKISKRIVDWRDPENTEDLSGYNGSINKSPKNAPFQSILELGQIPGISQKTALALIPYVTVYSGQDGVHKDLASPSFLLGFPNLLPVNKEALKRIIKGEQNVLPNMETILQDPALQGVFVDTESWAWAIDIQINSVSGFSGRTSAVITFVGGVENQNGTFPPYRILEYTGPLETISN